jgi:SAM-dependent MidA family methyltransferase
MNRKQREALEDAEMEVMRKIRTEPNHPADVGLLSNEQIDALPAPDGEAR